MSQKYKQTLVNANPTHFSAAPSSGIEFSRMVATPETLTTMNGGDIVPIYCREVLPNEEIDFKLDFVIRTPALSVPVMGQLYADFYAFFVPNRVVNQSWKEVNGENSYDSWAQSSDITLAPLAIGIDEATKIPVGSVADYYGFPTQKEIAVQNLREMNDLKFRGYLEIYNQYFRDQNYQPPIPYSKLNIYNGFLRSVGSDVSFNNSSTGDKTSSGSYPNGAVVKAVGGEGRGDLSFSLTNLKTSWNALSKPLKACKLHDYFTSVLPSPQKAASVAFAFPSSSYKLREEFITNIQDYEDSQTTVFPKFRVFKDGDSFPNAVGAIGYQGNGNDNMSVVVQAGVAGSPTYSNLGELSLPLAVPPHDITSIPAGAFGNIDLSTLREAIALQQVYELMARAGSRYRSFVKAFFGIEVDDPYKDIPEFLGKMRRELQNYQVAQTSASVEGGSQQGTLAAYSYTNSGGSLFHKKFLEHGYLHVFCVIRHRNLYSSFLSRDNFRLSMMEFYLPQLANIAEQPVYQRELAPFNSTSHILGYQEAWAEYRYEPSYATGYMRSGSDENVSLWNYSENYDETLDVIDDDFIVSNTQDIVDRALSVPSSTSGFQFLCDFHYTVDKTLPMPVYSVPGLDIF